jgi:hypothetical protein
MKNRVLWTLVAASALIAPLAAHHSFSAEFDDKQPIVLKGTVSKFEMVMPHSFVYVDVKDEKGTSTWAVEFANPNQLFRNGWNKNTMKPGQEVTIHDPRVAREGRVHEGAGHLRPARGWHHAAEQPIRRRTRGQRKRAGSEVGSDAERRRTEYETPDLDDAIDCAALARRRAGRVGAIAVRQLPPSSPQKWPS